MATSIPLVDISPLRGAPEDRRGLTAVAAAIDRACRDVGFFRIIGHGIPSTQRAELDRLARQFFALSESRKAEIAMATGGPAWRGWFPLDGELTSGRPDHKEGVYFGTELPTTDPRVVAGRPLHGPNRFPAEPVALAAAVNAWIEAMTDLGALLLRAVAVGLGLPPSWFADTVTDDPTILFRIFRYPPDMADGWGVAEHTDYGLLTILAQDGHAGLEVHGPNGWIEVPPDPDILVVNLGDMLERMTEGRYRSTPHRVRNASGAVRLSFPCFIDPSWEATCAPMPIGGTPPADDVARRWDGASVRAWDGTYGDYLTAKVSKVFPALFRTVSP